MFCEEPLATHGAPSTPSPPYSVNDRMFCFLEKIKVFRRELLKAPIPPIDNEWSLRCLQPTLYWYTRSQTLHGHGSGLSPLHASSAVPSRLTHSCPYINMLSFPSSSKKTKANKKLEFPPHSSDSPFLCSPL